MSSLVSCLCWVPKGVTKEIPDKIQLTTAEIQQLLKDAQKQLHKLELKGDKGSKGSEGGGRGKGGGSGKREESSSESEEGDGGDVQEGASGVATVEELYDLENYDDDEEEEGQKVSGAGMGNSLVGLTYYASNKEDPYITLKNVPPEDAEEDDFRVLPSDNLLVVGRAEEDFSSVEVYVYSESDDHCHSHHEILLSSYPLTLEWMDFDPEQPDKKGSYVAVGMLSPLIEVWDLDVIDALEPVFSLGNPDLDLRKGGKGKGEGRKKTKKKKKKEKEGASAAASPPPEGHSDAVLGLSWNKVVRNVLASASADCSVCVWDMTGPTCVLTIPHPDKVQCLQWHPYEPELLATGGFDSVVRMFNCKSPESAVKTWKVDGEVERVLWNHFQQEQLLVSTEGKTVWCLHKDSGASLFQIHTHTQTITDLSLSCHIPGLLVTASTDDSIKFWDIKDNTPVFLLSKEMHMGSVLCAKFCVDSPYALAVGGQRNGFHLFSVGRMAAVTQRFRDRGLMIPVTGGDEGEQSSSDTATATVHQDIIDGGEEDMEMEVDDSREGASAMSGKEDRTAHPKKKTKVHVKSKTVAHKKTKRKKWKH